MVIGRFWQPVIEDLRCPPPRNILNSPGFVWGILCCLPLVALAYFQPWFSRDETMTPAPPVSLAARLPDSVLPPAAGSAISQTPGYVGFDPPTLDIGSHFWGTLVPLRLRFVNQSSRSVEVLSSSTSCGCTVIQEDEHGHRLVGPSETLFLQVTLDTEKSLGGKNRVVTLSLDSGKSYTASISVDVVGTYRVTPTELDFGDILTEDGTLPVVRMVSFVSQTERLNSPPVSDSDWLNIRTAQRGESRTDILVSVNRALLPAGHSTATLTIHTTDTRVAPPVVFVHANGIQQLVPNPRHVFLLGAARQLVRFSDTTGERVRIISVHSTHDCIEVRARLSGEVEISNPSRRLLNDVVVVRVADDKQRRQGKVLVSTFPGQGN